MLWVSRKLVATTGAPVASAALAAAAFNVTFDAVPAQLVSNLWRAGHLFKVKTRKQEPRWPGAEGSRKLVARRSALLRLRPQTGAEVARVSSGVVIHKFLETR